MDELYVVTLYRMTTDDTACRLEYIMYCKPLTACGMQKCYCICFDVSAEGTYVDAAYFGELGYELMLFTPVAHYYQTQGVLRRTAATAGTSMCTCQEQYVCPCRRLAALLRLE